MMKTKSLLFLDGVFLPTTKFLEEHLTPGYMRGHGVFETMRAYRGHILALDRHLGRLSKGLKFFKLRSPMPLKRICFFLKILLKVNKRKNARVRLMIWQESAITHSAIVTLPYCPPAARKYRQGFKATLANQHCPFSSHKMNVKSIQYQPYLLAHQEAVRKGYDEAILLNTKGYLSEGSRSNLFFVKDHRLYTPSLPCGCLKGVTRDIVCQLAKRKGIITKFILARVKDLRQADEAFLTNSLMGIMPLTTLGRHKIGRGQVGPITKVLRQEYLKASMEKKFRDKGSI